MATTTQTCYVRVTGRRLRYQRALQIIQDEEYLSAIDFDNLRRRNDYQGYLQYLNRVKRQEVVYPLNYSKFTFSAFLQLPIYLIKNHFIF